VSVPSGNHISGSAGSSPAFVFGSTSTGYQTKPFALTGASRPSQATRTWPFLTVPTLAAAVHGPNRMLSSATETRTADPGSSGATDHGPVYGVRPHGSVSGVGDTTATGEVTAGDDVGSGELDGAPLAGAVATTGDSLPTGEPPELPHPASSNETIPTVTRRIAATRMPCILPPRREPDGPSVGRNDRCKCCRRRCPDRRSVDDGVALLPQELGDVVARQAGLAG